MNPIHVSLVKQGATVLQNWRAQNRDVRLDLSGADLRGLDLQGADLRDSDLGEADLSGADLRGTDLRGADLSGTDLRGALMSNAELSGADLRGTVVITSTLAEFILRFEDTDSMRGPLGTVNPDRTGEEWLKSIDGQRVRLSGFVFRSFRPHAAGVILRFLPAANAPEESAVSCYPAEDMHVYDGKQPEAKQWLALRPGQEVLLSGTVVYDHLVNRLFRLLNVKLETSEPSGMIAEG